MKNIIRLVAILLLATVADAQDKIEQPTATTIPAEIVASGGTFTLEKTVLAGGGSRIAQALFNQAATSGQPAAGLRSAGGQFTLYSGFWTPDNLTPTAASATLGGRILTSGGQGIRNVQVTLTFPSGEIRATASSAFGYYRFAEVPVGGVYVVTVAAKKYRFAVDSQVRQVEDDLRDVDFIANGQ